MVPLRSFVIGNVPDESPEKTAGTSSDDAAEADADLLGGLESLLEEEGSGFDLPDEELTENDLTDLFSDGGEESADDDVPAPARAGSTHDVRRQDRTARRRRDLEEYRNLEAHLQATPLGIEVGEDRMTARVSRITGDNTHEDITELLRREGITHGVDNEAIRAALGKAARGQNQFEVVVARGKPPRVLKPTEVVHHLPRDLITGEEETKTAFERLKLAIEGQYLEACKSWQGSVRIVRQGDTVSEIVAAQVEPGIDVFGQPLEIARVEDKIGRAHV